MLGPTMPFTMKWDDRICFQSLCRLIVLENPTQKEVEKFKRAIKKRVFCEVTNLVSKIIYGCVPYTYTETQICFRIIRTTKMDS